MCFEVAVIRVRLRLCFVADGMKLAAAVAVQKQTSSKERAISSGSLVTFGLETA